MNRNTLIVGIVALLVGSLITGVAGFYALPSLMVQEDQSPHDFETTTALFEQEIEDSGWSLVTTHDMQKTMEKHGYEDVDQIKIYELCNAGHASEILTRSDERIVTSMMPCRVAIYEKSDGNTYINRMNSGLIAKPFGGVVSEVMQQASAETEVVIEAVLETPPSDVPANVTADQTAALDAEPVRSAAA